MIRTKVLYGTILFCCLQTVAWAKPAEVVWRWEPDPVLNQQGRFGARGMWRDELWGFDYLKKSVWAYDGTQFKDGGSIPAGCSPLIASFTDHGVFAVAPCNVDGTPMAGILYSPDGYQDFQVSLMVDSSTDGRAYALGQDHSLVDLGEGRMFYFQYSDESRVMYTENAGQTWRMLFQPDGKAIRHWHGAYYDKEYGKLYAFAGDSDLHSTITVADDIFGENGFVNNPQLWKERWGLTDTQRSTRDEQYFLKPDGVIFSQRTRTVDMHVDGDYIYWGEDRAALGLSLYRANRTTLKVEEVGAGDIVGCPWRFLTLEDGTMLFATNSIWYQGFMVAGSDRFVRIYALNEERTDYREVERFPISRRTTTGADPLGFTEAFGRIWMNGYMVTEVQSDLVGQIRPFALGDFNGDLLLTVEDLDLLTRAIRNRDVSSDAFDLNGDNQLSENDRTRWIENIYRTYYGDSDLDGQFSSTDLIQVLRAGQYEDAVDGNSNWQTGDWDGDGDFTARDLIVCFQWGGYEKGVRAAVPVPEPASGVSLFAAWTVVKMRRRSRPLACKDWTSSIGS